jgi:hypothetical protein
MGGTNYRLRDQLVLRVQLVHKDQQDQVVVDQAPQELQDLPDLPDPHQIFSIITISTDKKK